MRKLFIYFLGPLLIVLVSVGAAVSLVKLRPEIERQAPVPPPPLVRTMTASPEDVQVFVDSQGTVAPRTETVLVAEVAGRVVRVSPSFADGGVFEKGDVLLQIDPTDYELAVVQAGSQVAQAQLRLAQEEAEAVIARQEWGDLESGEAPPLASRELQVAQAKAAFEAARAAHRQAERNLERARIRAPYSGRVRTTRVDVGQYVAPGTPVAEVFATDYVEVRLPIRDSELAFLDVPFDGRSGREGPAVVLQGDFAGRRHDWGGQIVRTEGEIDPQTRMVHLVARVEDPYRGRSGVPLSVGLFVGAAISGDVLEDVFVIPRSALRPGGDVLIVDSEDRLRVRPVDVLRVERERVFLGGGVESGERICLSNLQVVSDGMKVRTSGDAPVETSQYEPEPGLPGAGLSGAGLSGADLSGADLSGADLSGADLPGADLPGAVLVAGGDA